MISQSPGERAPRVTPGRQVVVAELGILDRAQEVHPRALDALRARELDQSIDQVLAMREAHEPSSLDRA
jgi:hypothetical protein